MKNCLSKLGFIILTFINMNLYAQVEDTLEVHRDFNGRITSATFKESKDPNQKQQNEIELLKSILQTKSGDEFHLIKTTGNKDLGLTHNFYQQYYKGIKVENAEYLVHSNKGIVRSINGDFQIISTSIIASITEKEALDKAKNYVNAIKYKWEDNNMERFIKENTKDSTATNFPIGELVICMDYLAGSNQFHLAWKFKISSLIPDNEMLIYVDATSGKIINKINLIFDSNAIGTAQTRYNFYPKTITTDFVSTNHYRLFETRNGVEISTRDLRKGTSYSPYYEFVDNDNNWTAAEWSNPAQDQCALDAHWGSEVVLDYWRNIRHRNSIDGNGLRIHNYIHYDNNWDNAQWDAASKVMRYGDGDGIIFSPLTALDVTAHEFGHGICQFTANLAYVANESSALNEGFSDIWGAVIEGWADPYKNKWHIGEDITLIAPGYYRSMIVPPNGIEARVNTYHGTYWYYGTDPDVYSHTNMGVLNHWFYLLSEGGTGWNNGYTSHANANDGYCWTVTPIGINDAARIAYITESHYLNSSANYNAMRNASIQAALDSFGINSYQVISVTNAWNAVGVGNAYHYIIEGPTLLCDQGSYVINHLPTGATITWLDPSPNITRISSQGSNPCIFQKFSTGNGFINASIDCGNINVSLPVHTGSYGSSDYPIAGPSSSPCKQYVYYWIQPLVGVTSINWSWPSGWTYISGQGTTYLTLRTGNYSGMVAVGVNNTCGQSGSYATKFTSVYGSCGYSLIVSPNPATNEVTISVNDSTGLYEEFDNSNSINLKSTYIESPKSDNYIVKIYNNQGTLLSTFNRAGRTFSIPLDNLLDGIYIVEVNNGKISDRKQLVVKHN